MSKLLPVLIALTLAISLIGCNFGITRQETDIYTISERDTSTLFYMQNAPGNRDNGVVYPSSRTFKSSRYLIQKDSIVDRFYPDFIRIGAFESVGLFLGGNYDNSLNSGLFGIFPNFDRDLTSDRGDSGKIFVGGIYRFGIGEWRLRWFRDAANWTIGTSAFEILMPDSRLEKALTGIFPLYIRKRYFLKETIPYIAITPAVGIGYYPSQYVNLSASLDIGSISGLNFRAYVGLAAGSNGKDALPVKESQFSDESQTSVFPYAGLGVSFLDFLNIVPETLTEWKYHEHSGWNIGLIQFGFIKSGSKFTAFSDTSEESFFNGFILRLCNASVAIPWEAVGNKLYVGTSAVNLLMLGREDWGIGMLPLRIGWWQTLIQDELTLEPFFEYNYYPSTILHLGARMNLRMSEQINVGLMAGFTSGTTNIKIGNTFTDQFGNPLDVSTGYIGVSIGLWDKIFFPDDLRYGRDDIPYIEE